MKETSNENIPKRNINKEFDIDIFSNTLKKNWYWVPIFISSFLMVAMIYLRYTKPVYEARSIIQLGNIDEGKKVVDIENVSTIGDELSRNVELLKSELILRKALKRLKLNVSYFSKGNILTEQKYKDSSYQITPLEIKDSSIIGRQIHVTSEEGYVVLEYDHNGHNVDRIKSGEVYENQYFKVVLKVIKQDVLDRALSENELFFTFNDFKLLATSYIPNLSIKILNPEAKSIEIKYRSNHPVLSRDIVESVVNTFFEHDFDKKQEGSAKILSFINKQLDSISDQLEFSENRILAFKKDNNISNPEDISSNMHARITALEGQVVELELEAKLLRKIDEVLNESPDKLEVYNLLPGIVGSQFETSLNNQVKILNELLLQRDEVKFTSAENNATLINLNKRVKQQVETIKKILEAFQTKVSTQKEAIESKIRQIDNSFYGLDVNEMELSRLDRLFRINEKYYVLLLEKKAQYSISKEGFTTSNLVLTEVTTPTGPISPRRNLIIISAILLGFIVGSVIFFFKYILYNEINSPEELKKLMHSQVAFLGYVPKISNPNEHSHSVVFDNPKSMAAESFRNLRANLNFTIKDNDKPTTIGITSTIPGEGKTFVSINLASIYSLSSKKTVIIDMDMRKPKIHVGFEIKNEKGISDVLSGKEKLENVIRKTNNEFLSLITAGTIPPNPNELILNNQIDTVVEELKNIFDIIIIDNPPVGVVSDGIEILKKVDIPIFIVRANYSKRYFANNISSYISEGKLTRLFTVLNSFSTKKSDYSYSYGYGNYYHEEEAKKKSIFAKLFKRK